MTPSRSRSDSLYCGPHGYGGRSPVAFGSEELIAEPVECRGMGIVYREREFQRGDEISWYADGDKIVRNEYNPATAYAFDRVFGPHTFSQEVYDVAAKPVVKAAMEGVNGRSKFSGIIPLAIKDVFGHYPRWHLCEGIKEEVVLSPGHALLFIAAGEEHRHVGSNNFNLLSSRSHTIFTLMIESSAHGDEYDGVIFSQLNLIDLAGSESSKTETTGLRRKEGSYINKSLLTLGTLEEGQVKMQSRLEEEEEAKAALMSRIQRLTKLILVSTKNTIPGLISDVPGHQRSHSVGDDDKLDVLREDALHLENENQKDSLSSASVVPSDALMNLNTGDLPARCNDTRSDGPASRAGKDAAGEIAFSTSTLKRLVEQSVNDPDSSKIQTVMRLMTQCNEKSFELEIKTADNRVLQEQLQTKCSQNKELQEKVKILEKQLASFSGDKTSLASEHAVSEEYVDELKKKVQSQLSEENSGLRVQNQKLAEEASYAKELASAAAVELKNLAGEVTKLSLQNAKLEKELLAARESVHSREDLKMELLARKQREASLETALAEKEFIEEEYRKKAEEAKKREAALENDLANMWVLVAKLKKEGGYIPEVSTDERHSDGIDPRNQKLMRLIKILSKRRDKFQMHQDCLMKVRGAPGCSVEEAVGETESV
ncbi:hypothetical protein GH714_030399 [Hevea brasiliensis]|uniref:Kinesin-like protein n=1 Tax=Hevea brasiliensis TaxID=3981 RepID=A0A6A6LNT5_HEVBR|nr:hypothetical protein GH714_030399 [Hevea brasiliensis]